MYSFELNNVHQLNDFKQLKSGCYLCIWHADKVPPHIGIIIDGCYFSLKVKGKDVEIPVGEIVNLINRKKICTVFVEIKVEIYKENVAVIYSKYFKANTLKSTCLTPIVEVFDNVKNVQILADLLNFFKSKNQIGEIFGLHLTENYKGIPLYNLDDIEMRLKLLSKN